MKYETIGYVKSIKASTNPEELKMGFMPVGAYLFEDNGEYCCVYRETGTQNAKLVAIEKGRLLNTLIKCKMQLKLMLILAKANNAKIKIEVTCEGDAEPKSPLAITAIEYV